MKFALVLAICGGASAQAVTCPATIAPGQVYQRISVLNKDKGQEYDLAPDIDKKTGARVTQTWRLKDYRELPLIVRCHYAGTDKVIDRELPGSLQTCTQHFNIDGQGRISGPFDMECR